ncbi:MAG: hypothetical protein U5L00_01950 [Desulfovermiculus sp.]|nr:hypothetical protein [Desulfovermiculus sp.]
MVQPTPPIRGQKFHSRSNRQTPFLRALAQKYVRLAGGKADLSQEIGRSKHDILRWTTGLLFAQLITILAALLGVTFL